MENRAIVLTLVSLTVLASGCLHTGGGETRSEGPQSVQVVGLSVSPSTIYKNQHVRASLTAMNAGNLPAEVSVGDRGRQVLIDNCPDVFKNTKGGYTAFSSTVSRVQESYRLKPGERLSLRWRLEQEGSVPLYGKRCKFEFSLPFNYSVEAFRQVQIKNSSEVQGSSGLSSSSSSGPMVLSIDTIPGITGKPATYISGEKGDQRISFSIQLINKDIKEKYRKGLVDVHEESIYIRATEPLELSEAFQRSGNGELEWGIVKPGQVELKKALRQPSEIGPDYSKERCNVPETELKLLRGRSVTITCSVPVPEDIDAPSVLSEIRAGINYTYVKDAGSRTVRVKPRG